MEMLRPEFPDVSISKIRFLEAEGLVEPQRTPSGYRKFGPSDVDRLRYVLRAQRDQYLPLKVIKDQLDAIDRGLEPVDDGRGAVGAEPDGSGPHPDAGAEGPARPPVLLDRAELLAAAGIDEAALARLEEFGLIEPRRTVPAPVSAPAPVASVPASTDVGVADDGPAERPGEPGEAEAEETAPVPAPTPTPAARLYDGDALVIARLVTALGEYGLEPRHLRQVKAAADREAALVEQIVAPLTHRRGAGARTGAEEVVRDLVSLTSRLHTVLVGAALRPLLER
ncbi:MerR family transcriptional regulator [Yinghuangia sp. ASG 101]|uniref:transcriptional regulator FtsR n=1 Tax=Yinghuangia sp. ASG 101 TaxID=2896848 RepID=UPI001E5D87FC|nr:MerR family transcriptional regulator [Yinghuangia sp. ASG 101]UGQ15630.1 MerR family transcriptional regulator [Yinghuangia sp. ASG 101]